jgi:hypothetical protein
MFGLFYFSGVAEKCTGAAYAYCFGFAFYFVVVYCAGELCGEGARALKCDFEGYGFTFYRTG